MNRLIINGVTIEYPEDSSLTVNGSFVSINHVAKKEEKATVHEVEYVNDIPKITQHGHRALPKDIDKLIVRYLRTHEGRNYTIGITKMVARTMKHPLTWPTKQALLAKLDEMVEVGVLVILAKTPHTLYGLASMQQLPVADDKPDEHPTEYVNG